MMRNPLFRTALGCKPGEEFSVVVALADDSMTYVNEQIRTCPGPGVLAAQTSHGLQLATFGPAVGAINRRRGLPAPRVDEFMEGVAVKGYATQGQKEFRELACV
jgi:hypothetical protein